MSLRVLIVDDEPIARRRLKALLAAEASVDVVGESEDGESALAAIRRLRPGPGVPRRPDARPRRIRRDRAAEAGRVSGGHLRDGLRPVRDARVRRARGRLPVEAVRARPAAQGARARGGARRKRRDPGAAPRARRHAFAPAQPLRRFLVKTPGRVYAVRADDVESLEAAGHYVELRTATGTHLVRDSMAALERRLDPARFVRIHRSTIVNVDKVKELRPAFHGEFEVVLSADRRLRCSRTYAAELTRVLEA